MAPSDVRFHPDRLAALGILPYHSLAKARITLYYFEFSRTYHHRFVIAYGNLIKVYYGRIRIWLAVVTPQCRDLVLSKCHAENMGTFQVRADRPRSTSLHHAYLKFDFP